VLIICLLILGIANNGPRNISLAIGTLAGALVLLVIQLTFELQSTESISVFKTQFTTDNERPKIEQFRYPMSSFGRPINEIEANKFLLATNPSAFQGDGEKLWKDMSIFGTSSMIGRLRETVSGVTSDFNTCPNLISPTSAPRWGHVASGR